MNRLKKVAKPRAKKKQVVLTVKFAFETYNDNNDEAKLDCKRFKDWMKQQFTEWDDSVLQYFLYAYKLKQEDEDSKYLLDMHIDRIISDDSATLDERKRYQLNLDEENEEEFSEKEEEFDKEILENDDEDIIDDDEDESLI